MSLKSPPEQLLTPTNITNFPREIHLNILTFLRATDLSSLQRTSRTFNNRILIGEVVNHYANVVYPSDLTQGFDTPIVSGEVKSVAVCQTASYFAANKKSKRKSKQQQQQQQQLVSSPASTNTTTPAIAAPDKVYTYEMLRNMEMVVVARVLSRPEPPIHERDSCFYVSKSWCRAALSWLEVQEEERKEREERKRHSAALAAEEANLKLAAASTSSQQRTPGKGGKGGGKHNRKSPHPGSSGKKKLSRKEQKQRDRRMSNSLPPWSNINTDIVCEHGSLQQCSTKSARARRRVMDKQAWRVLKRLYPESVQLEAHGSHVLNGGGCLLCAAEAETIKKAENDKKEDEKDKRKAPLANDLVRQFYTRGSKGYPLSCQVEQSLAAVSSSSSRCPLKPGVYCALPRSWCKRWRKYIKTGEGGFPLAPDASEVLYRTHNLPLVPPHLESFLRGETSTLLSGSSTVQSEGAGSACSFPIAAVGASAVARSGSTATSSRATSDAAETLQALRAAGLSESEVHAQRVAMSRLEDSMRLANIHDIHELNNRTESESSTGTGLQQTITNEQLDRENRVVVEILTDDEVTELEKSWPRCHGGTYALRFAVVEGSNKGDSDIVWSTTPCRACDPSSLSSESFVVRNRLQKFGYR